MVEIIKNQLWDLLKEKKVSLVMIYDEAGKILWHRGRHVVGKTIEEGEGFPKSYINQTIGHEGNSTHSQDESFLRQENIVFNVSSGDLSRSAEKLHLKSLVILPIDKRFFLYIDSGTRESFSRTDYEVFKIIGRLLSENIRHISKREADIRGITGSSAAISGVKDLVLKFSLEEDPVLLLGDTGVGKTHIAELIHLYSGRKGRFVVADTTTINENLFESEVFGHKKGSFTGAESDKPGLIDEAEGGTLFFDEIAEVPVSFQAKLLRFIDKKKYRALGETIEKEADVRIVAATNKDLQKAIEDKEFRDDLYFRLSVLEIKIPPLKDRLEDIKDVLNEQWKLLKGKEPGEGFWRVMLDYDWPGNFRELFTVIKRTGILCESPVTGEQIRKIIGGAMAEDNSIKSLNRIDVILAGLKKGKSFWEMVKTPYLNRDLNRSEVRTIISRVLLEAGGKYVDTLPYFNLEPSEYKRFMKFLNKNKLQ